MGPTSMTGYGRSTIAMRDVSVDVEMRSVNARHLSVRCRLPNEWMRLEGLLEALVKRRLKRGAVDILVRIKVTAATPKPRIDRAVLAAYNEVLDELGGGDKAALLRLPGVISIDEPSLPVRRVERAVLRAAHVAASQLKSSRDTEGANLAVVMEREIDAFGRHLAVIERLVPRAVRRHHLQLRRRVGQLLEARSVDRDDPVLLRELAVLADRSDITEEVDRLASHLQTLRERLQGKGAVGRELEFVLQEIGREANTIAAKAGDVTMTGRAIRMKSCVERLREQAANLE